jgi:hypothetical protein
MLSMVNSAWRRQWLVTVLDPANPMSFRVMSFIAVGPSDLRRGGHSGSICMTSHIRLAGTWPIRLSWFHVSSLPNNSLASGAGLFRVMTGPAMLQLNRAPA